MKKIVCFFLMLSFAFSLMVNINIYNETLDNTTYICYNFSIKNNDSISKHILYRSFAQSKEAGIPLVSWSFLELKPNETYRSSDFCSIRVIPNITDRQYIRVYLLINDNGTIKKYVKKYFLNVCEIPKIKIDFYKNSTKTKVFLTGDVIFINYTLENCNDSKVYMVFNKTEYTLPTKIQINRTGKYLLKFKVVSNTCCSRVFEDNIYVVDRNKVEKVIKEHNNILKKEKEDIERIKDQKDNIKNTVAGEINKIKIHNCIIILIVLLIIGFAILLIYMVKIKRH